MSVSFWFSVMHVMGRLGIWKPYLTFVEKFLNWLGESDDKESKGKVPLCPRCIDEMGGDVETQREIILYYLIEHKTNQYKCPHCGDINFLAWIKVG